MPGLVDGKGLPGMYALGEPACEPERVYRFNFQTNRLSVISKGDETFLSKLHHKSIQGCIGIASLAPCFCTICSIRFAEVAWQHRF